MTELHVLLVEDNEDNRDMMKFLLERAGYVVSTANTGREALVSARREKPDVILMDRCPKWMAGPPRKK
jgi:CheY-like chemotaxis protein